ncbi:ATP-grasp domain-containing protein [Kineosporia sp. A_224]|uniref:ATP-grasp domain-containing protein n=1 Tax=Kineosporia sp. A_224 TaxID=1962180 RepID=UPI000B4BC085|nr:ATP-grasp domain-containing protein [Kineosporia sp. A_224]
MLLVVPSDPLRARLPDPHFADEAAAARELGVTLALLDHDALVGGRASEATSRVPESDDVVYRGWMVSAEQYADMEQALATRGARLRSTSQQFRTAHELPGWYGALEAHTPQAVWSSGSSTDAIEDLCAELAPAGAVLRDYVKSMKHYWDEACYIPDVSDLDTARRIAERFIELRDDSFTGGLVLRRFEHFEGAELRTWWIDGRLALSSAHPDTPDSAPDGPADVPGLSEQVAALGLPFVTVDLARRDDATWRVIELGDGQVSDRPRAMPAQDLIAALAR